MVCGDTTVRINRLTHTNAEAGRLGEFWGAGNG